MWNRIGSINSGATHQSPLASRVPRVQVAEPPPEVVTLGRTNDFDAATYSGTGNWLPTPDSEYVEDITTNARIRYLPTFGGGSFEFTPLISATFNGTFGTTSGSEDPLTELSIETWHFYVPSTDGIIINCNVNVGFVPSWELNNQIVVSDNMDPPVSATINNVYQYLVPRAWNQVVMTFGLGSYVKLYVNGALVATSADVSPVVPATGATTISAGDGSIAIIRAYDRIITDAEVLQNYNAVQARFVYTQPTTAATTGLTNYFDTAPSGVSPTKYSGVGYDSSGVWRDQVGTADMTLYNTPAYDSSTSGGQLTFVAASSQYGASLSSLVNTDNMTVEIWYKPTTTASLVIPIISSYVDPSNTPWALRNIGTGTTSYNRIAASSKYLSAQSNTPVNTPNLVAGTWYQITLRKVGGADGHMIRTINSATAIRSVSQTYPYPNSATATDLFLMTDDSTNKRNGIIGLVRIYNTALNNAEILQNYNATKARFGLA
jgi:hypothetical protein